MDVDEGLSRHRLQQARPLDLAGLEDYVPVGEEDDRSPLPEVLDHVERGGEEAVGERVVGEEERDLQEVHVVRALHPVPLEGAQVVRIAQLRTQDLEDLPVPLLPVGADLALQVPSEIEDDPIVVEERVVHVEEEHHVGAGHGALIHRRPPGRGANCRN